MRYRIVCTNQEPVNEPTTHAHIVAVGTGSDLNKADQKWTLDEVLSAMDRGDEFYTKGEQSGRIAADESRKARLALAGDLSQKTKEVTDLQEILKQREEKLAEAQKVQADLLKKQRELDDARRELDLTVEKRIQEGLNVTRQQGR